MSEEVSPLSQMYKLRDRLTRAVEARKWPNAHNRARELTRLIPQVLEQEGRWGKAHFDGIYEVGTMQIGRAPKKAHDAILQFNAALGEAKAALNKKRKKKR